MNLPNVTTESKGLIPSINNLLKVSNKQHVNCIGLLGAEGCFVLKHFHSYKKYLMQHSASSHISANLLGGIYVTN